MRKLLIFLIAYSRIALKWGSERMKKIIVICALFFAIGLIGCNSEVRKAGSDDKAFKFTLDTLFDKFKESDEGLTNIANIDYITDVSMDNGAKQHCYLIVTGDASVNLDVNVNKHGKVTEIALLGEHDNFNEKATNFFLGTIVKNFTSVLTSDKSKLNQLYEKFKLDKIDFNETSGEEDSFIWVTYDTDEHKLFTFYPN